MPIKMPNKKNRPTQAKQIEKAKKIVEKQEVRRIGFDFPAKTLDEFKVAVSMRKEPSMTSVLITMMDNYSDNVRKEKGLARLSD